MPRTRSVWSPISCECNFCNDPLVLDDEDDEEIYNVSDEAILCKFSVSQAVVDVNGPVVSSMDLLLSSW